MTCDCPRVSVEASRCTSSLGACCYAYACMPLLPSPWRRLALHHIISAEHTWIYLPTLVSWLHREHLAKVCCASSSSSVCLFPESAASNMLFKNKNNFQPLDQGVARGQRFMCYPRRHWPGRLVTDRGEFYALNFHVPFLPPIRGNQFINPSCQVVGFGQPFTYMKWHLGDLHTMMVMRMVDGKRERGREGERSEERRRQKEVRKGRGRRRWGKGSGVGLVIITAPKTEKNSGHSG